MIFTRNNSLHNSPPSTSFTNSRENLLYPSQNFASIPHPLVVSIFPTLTFNFISLMVISTLRLSTLHNISNHLAHNFSLLPISALGILAPFASDFTVWRMQTQMSVFL
jgi:hypothetical protein